MPRFWNTGICLMALLVNGLTDKTKNTLQNKGANETTILDEVSCVNQTLPPDTWNCSKHICPKGQKFNVSYPCIPGYKKDGEDCIENNECSDKSLCGLFASCKNTAGAYYCICDKGYQRDNKTKFCLPQKRSEKMCTDIDECKDFPDICVPNATCSNTPGSYKCICNAGFINVSNVCEEKVKCIAQLCGLKDVCEAKMNRIYCSCQEGFKAISLGLKYPQCNVRCKYSMSKEKCEHEPFQCKMKNFVDKFTPYCDNVTNIENLSLEMLLEDLDDLIDGFSYHNKTDRLQKAGKLLTTVEFIVQDLALVEQKKKSYANKMETISIQVSLGAADSGTLSLQSSNSNIKMDSKTAAGNTGLALLGSIEYTNIHHIMKEADLLEEISNNKSIKLVSPVVSVFLGIKNTTSLRHPVSMRLNFTDRKEEMKSRNMSCVSWSVSDHSWTTNGCVMLDSDEHGVVCNCTHLTSFAVLLLLHDHKGVLQSWTLTLITQIGLAISIFCLVLAIISFCFCRSLHGTRNIIHMHLCISLFLGNCIFLLGITAVDNKVVCGIVAGLLHAFYLCSFCWMALEGLELYLMLVTVFNTHLKKRYLLAVGYGVPALIVTISAAIYHEGYGTDKYCWLSVKKGFIWAFMGPVCAIILVNCGIFVLTVWRLAEKMSSVITDHKKLQKIRTLTVTSVAQLCILGLCWVFGFFMFSSATLFFAYVFTILNALQGIQIFCLHCLMRRKVRAEYKTWLCALAHFKSPVYSEFSNTSNSQTQSKGKPSKESGL